MLRHLPESPEGRGYIRWWASIVLSLVLVSLLVRYAAGESAFIETLATARAWPVVLATTVVGINVILDAVRWSLVLSAMGVSVPFRRTLHAVVATWPLAIVVPSRAGDFARPLYLKPEVPLTSGVGSVLAGKMIDAQNLALFAAVGCVVIGMTAPAFAAVGVWLGIGALGLAMVLSAHRIVRLPVFRRRPERVEQMVLGLRALGTKPAVYVGLVLLSLASWANVSLIVTLLLTAFGAPVSFLFVWALFPFANFVGSIPVTLGGLGTRDAAFLIALNAAGVVVDPAPVLSATLGYAVLGTWLPALVALPLILRRGR